MLKFLFLVTIFLSINNFSFAKIIEYTNEFTNSKYILSEIERDKKLSYTKFPNTVTFRKSITNNKSEYTLFLITSGSQAISPLDATAFKTYSTSSPSIYLFDPTIDYSNFPTASYKLSDLFINEINQTDKLSLQIPLFTYKSTRIKYLYYEFDKQILNEWKQVIAME